ncbi:hypothetical protein AB7250_20735 [Providencia stuartii]|uniref:Uncharacterized protein n=1 Tax=Providencia stuartii TaxID=588 RepID=A0AAI9DBB8_PROST|nr:hypothetical protein [Providencia stuartii]
MELEKLKSKLDIKNWNELKNNDDKRNYLFEIIKEENFSESDVLSLMNAIPNFIQLQKDQIDGLKSIISSAKEVQKDALKGMTSTLDSAYQLLSQIVNMAETDELRLKCAEITLELAKYSHDISNKINEANESNNQTYKSLAVAVSSVVVIIAGLFFRRK